MKLMDWLVVVCLIFVLADTDEGKEIIREVRTPHAVVDVDSFVMAMIRLDAHEDWARVRRVARDMRFDEWMESGCSTPIPSDTDSEDVRLERYYSYLDARSIPLSSAMKRRRETWR